MIMPSNIFKSIQQKYQKIEEFSDFYILI